ncbi:MAG: hypothetical protein ACI4WX_14920 [Aristaeellaceae bacterium]
MKKIIWLLLVALVFSFGVTAMAEEDHTHSFSAWTETKPATCTEAGERVRFCACGTIETEAIPAAHSWGEWSEFMAGVLRRECKVCRTEEFKNTGDQPATCDHTYGEWKVTTAATCTEAGEKTRTCTKCNDAQKETIAATGHAYGEWKVTTAATCTDAGEKTRTCANCNDVQKEAIAALGHTWGEWNVTPTGKMRMCSVCGAVEKETSGCDHNYGIWNVKTEPTCTEEGQKVRICSKCGDVQKEAIPAAGHAYGEWNVKTPGTCSKAGEKVRICSKCGDVQKEAIVVPHTYGEWNVKTEATCTKAGEKLRMCSVCGYVDKAEIAKLGHTEVVVPGKAATCTEAGITDGKKCSVCGEITVAQTEIAAKGHTEVELPAVAATCTETGLTAGKKCSVCDTVLVAQTEVEAIGHKYVVKVIAPTTTSRGYNANRCKNCGNFFRSNYVDKLAAEVVIDNLGDIVFDAEMNAVAYTAVATQDAAKVLTIKADVTAKPVVRILSLTLEQVELLKAEGYQTIVFVVGEHELVIPMDVFAQDMLNVVLKDLGEAAVGYNFTVECAEAACTMKVEITTAEGATDVTVIVTGVELK